MTYREAQQEVRRMVEYREKRYGKTVEVQKSDEKAKPAKYYSR